MLETIPGLFARLNPQLQVCQHNDRFARYWRPDGRSIHDQSLRSVLGSAFGQLESSLERVRLGETVQQLLVRYDESGELAWLDVHLCPAPNQPNEILFYATDITTVKQRERSLKSILDNLPAVVLFLDLDLRIRYANQQAAELLGIREEFLFGRNYLDCLDSPAAAQAQSSLQSNRAGCCTVMEEKLTFAGGRTCDMLVHHIPETNALGQVIGFYKIAFDISSVKQIEAELQKVRSRFELAIRGSSLGVWEFSLDDPDWIFADHIERLLGFAPGSLNNSRKQIRKLVHRDDRELNDRLNQPLSLDGCTKGEIRIRTASGNYRWFRVICTVDLHDNGTLKWVGGTITDIDDLKRAELAAEAQVRRRDEFLAMMSHELRNPMTAIAYSAKLAEIDEGLSQATRETLQIIQRQTGQLTRLTDDLLDVSRITRNRIVYKMEPHDFNSALLEGLECIRPIIDQRQQQLTVNLCDSPTTVRGDASRLRQAIANVLENASKYTPEKGRIEVTTRLDSKDVVFRIRDNGFGISPDMQANIFELFYQHDKTIDRSSGGLGVGLYLVKNIVQAHGGQIDVFSEGAGKGSEFVIRLPICEQAREVATSTELRFDGLRLMLVEDSLDAQHALSWLLQDRGFEVTAYADGLAASQSIVDLKPNVAIIDLGLPKRNGFDLARDIRRAENRGKIDRPILIALTGYGQSSDRQKALDSGFDDHLVKPCHIDRLCESIQLHCRRAKSA